MEDFEPVESMFLCLKYKDFYISVPAELYGGSHQIAVNSMFPSLFMSATPTRPPPIPPQNIMAPVSRNHPPSAGSVISAPAQVATASAIGPSQPVIACQPQMRDLWKETTRFVPSNVQAKKPGLVKPKKTISYSNPYASIKPSTTFETTPKTKEEKSKDDVCDEFLASLGDLL